MGNQSPGSGKKCPNGHIMDPSWTVCPYCERDKPHKEPFNPKKNYESDGRIKTAIGGREKPKRGRRETAVMDGGAKGGGDDFQQEDPRRILGILVTFSWKNQGEIFLIREGKNYAGSGEEMDIQITADDEMSREHMLIRCLKTKSMSQDYIYQISDEKSTNGVYLNEELVPVNGTELPNNATIQTGATIWTFIMIQASQTGQAPPPEKQREEPPKEKEPRDPTIAR